MKNIHRTTIKTNSGLTQPGNKEKAKTILTKTINKINIKKAYWLILPDCSKLTCLLNFKENLINPEGPKSSIKPLSINLYVVL